MPRRFEPLDEAKKDDWIVISMKNDWRRIFAFECAAKSPIGATSWALIEAAHTSRKRCYGFFHRTQCGMGNRCQSLSFQEAYSAKNSLTLLSSLSKVMADSLCVQMDCSAGP
jgi:hypothetical protein